MMFAQGALPKTDPELLRRLVERARNYRMTPQEVRDQRVSFVWGQIGPGISKDEVRRILAAQLGWDDQ